VELVGKLLFFHSLRLLADIAPHLQFSSVRIIKDQTQTTTKTKKKNTWWDA
jgi:hypothetical protein